MLDEEIEEELGRFDFVATLALLVDNGQFPAQTVHIASRSLHVADIGGHHG